MNVHAYVCVCMFVHVEDFHIYSSPAHQVVLKCSAGMDYFEFVQFLSLLSLPRLSQLQSLLSTELPLSWLIEMKSLVAKFTSKPWTFFPSGVLMEHQPADNLAAILSSSPHCYEPPLLSEETKLLSSELNNKRCIHLLLFRAYELKVIHSVMQEINI